MRTLDEVVKALEICANNQRCIDGCPYYKNDCPQYEMEKDALRYLKELQKMTDIPMEYFENGGTSQELRNTSQITCPKCHSVFEILDDPDGDRQQLLKCQALLQDFYRNDPLSWDELTQMIGKPVWVECKFYSHQWAIIGEVTENRIRFYGPRLVDGEPQEEIGITWQAYRKER